MSDIVILPATSLRSRSTQRDLADRAGTLHEATAVGCQSPRCLTTNARRRIVVSRTPIGTWRAARRAVRHGWMPTLEETLKRLATTFNVRDIMIPNADLVCANDEEEAAVVSHNNPDFNVIPIRQDGKLTGYFERKSRSTKKIAPNDLISDGTSLLDLVGILEHREFSFVLSSEQAQGYGYVHFSDLNHHLVKLTFYVILAALERVALDSIRGKDDREFLKTNLSPARFNHIEEKYKDAGEAARSLVSYLNIRELLRLAGTAGTLHVEESVAKAVKNARDGASHASKNLVSKHEHVKEIAKVKSECLRVLGAR